MALCSYLQGRGVVKTEKIAEAFSFIDRADFVREEDKGYAYEDRALPAGRGQTISQPQVVAFMLELLELKAGQKILDVGFGSGWTTALLAYVVSKGGENKEGRVIAVEIIPEIYEFGKNNISKYNFLEKNVVKTFCRDGRKGAPEEAPFDGILVSAAEEKEGELPEKLQGQLKTGGRAVMPVHSSIILFKKEEDRWEKEEFPGFSFVPLV